MVVPDWVWSVTAPELLVIEAAAPTIGTVKLVFVVLVTLEIVKLPLSVAAGKAAVAAGLVATATVLPPGQDAATGTVKVLPALVAMV